MSALKWGILSTANIGIKRVIPAILAGQRGTVSALASRDAGHAAKIAADFGIARSYGSYQALLDDPAIEAVYNPTAEPSPRRMDGQGARGGQACPV